MAEKRDYMSLFYKELKSKDLADGDWFIGKLFVNPEFNIEKHGFMPMGVTRKMRPEEYSLRVAKIRENSVFVNQDKEPIVPS